MTAHITATTAPASDRQATVLRFLEVLAGDSESGELLELRYRLEDGRMGQLFDSLGRLRGLATRALMLGRRTDVYVGCAPRTRRHGGRDAVARAFVLWADCDGEHAVDALERFEPQPSIVIASGSGRNCHAYWPLTEPLERQRDRARQPPARARARRRPRVGRRRPDPAPARDLLAQAPAARARRGAAAGRRPAHAGRRRRRRTGGSAARAARRRAPPVQQGDDPLLAIAPDVYVRRLLGVEVPRHRKVRCPFHADRHASLHVYETAERGWYCYGRCRRGGTIYDLAAPLYGYDAARRGLPAPARRAASPVRAGWCVMAAADVDFMYVQTDVPPGVTHREWRMQRRRERGSRHRPLRALRERVVVLGARARAIRPAVAGRPEVRDSSDAHGRIPA